MVVTYTVLYTGFLPFDDGTGSRPANPSGEAATEMGKRGKLEFVGRGGATLVAKLVTRVFDVLWSLPAEGGKPSQSGAADEMEKAIAEVHPDVVIATGMAGLNFRVEQRAEDTDDPFGLYKDNNGRQPSQASRHEFPKEPLYRPTSLPFKAIQDAWKKAGVTNYEESTSAGNFICEDVFYRVMRAASKPENRILRAGFIHVPAYPATTVEKIVAAMEIALRETLWDLPAPQPESMPREPSPVRTPEERKRHEAWRLKWL